MLFTSDLQDVFLTGGVSLFCQLFNAVLLCCDFALKMLWILSPWTLSGHSVRFRTRVTVFIPFIDFHCVMMCLSFFFEDHCWALRDEAFCLLSIYWQNGFVAFQTAINAAIIEVSKCPASKTCLKSVLLPRVSCLPPPPPSCPLRRGCCVAFSEQRSCRGAQPPASQHSDAEPPSRALRRPLPPPGPSAPPQRQGWRRHPCAQYPERGAMGVPSTTQLPLFNSILLFST